MQDPSVLRPSTWAVRTPKTVVTGKEEWVRLGFEDKDLPRPYNAKDVLEEVAFMYQTAHSVYVRNLSICLYLKKNDKLFKKNKHFH